MEGNTLNISVMMIIQGNMRKYGVAKSVMVLEKQKRSMINNLG